MNLTQSPPSSLGRTALLLVFAITSTLLSGQNYYLRKDAGVLNSTAGCYQLSPSKNWTSGAIWHKDKVSLSTSFKKEYMLYFDNDDNGADGLAFVLHNDTRKFATDPTSGYIGYQGITPSFAVEFDIFYNSNLSPDTKPSAGGYDHIDLVKNGDVYAWPSLLTGGAVSALPNNGNIEDGKCHNVLFDWDATNKVVRIYFDGFKRIEQGIDLKKDIFNNVDSVYWGFTAGTGGQKTNHYLCEGNYFLTVRDTCIFKGDTVSLSNNAHKYLKWKPQTNISCDSCPSPKVWPSVTTKYHASITNGICTITDTATIQVVQKSNYTNPKFLGSDTFICTFPFTLKPIINFNSYLWSTGSASKQISVNKTGTFWMQGKEGNKCPVISDTIHIYTDSIPKLTLTGDTLFCGSGAQKLSVSEKNNLPFVWSTGSTQAEITVTSGQKYYVVAKTKCTKDSLFFTAKRATKPNIILPKDTLICFGSITLGTPRTAYTTYLWENGDTNRLRSISASGNYTLIASNFCGKDTASVNVAIGNSTTVTISGDTITCGADTGTLTALATFANQYKWSTGATTKSIQGNAGISYWVIATNQCGEDTADAAVSRIEWPLAALPKDTISCAGTIVLNASVGAGCSLQWDNNSTAAQRTFNTAGNFYVIAANYCGSDTADINIAFLKKPTIQLSGDTFLCAQNNGTVNANVSDAPWKWSNGSVAASIPVSAGNSYYITAQNFCGSDSIGFRIIRHELPLLGIRRDTLSCHNPIILGTFQANTSYFWADGSQTVPRSLSGAGSYKLVAIGKCMDSISFNLTFDSIPQILITNDTFLCEGAELTVADKRPTNLATTYAWSDGVSATPRKFTKPGTYTVTKSNICGEVTDEIVIADSCNYCKIWLPNAFSPSQFDGTNRFYKPVFSCNPIEYEIRIYNRWGQKVFESNTLAEAWDGTYLGLSVPVGVYAVAVSALVVDGNITVRRMEKASITVLK